MNLFAVINYDPGDGYWDKIINQTDSCSYEERVHSILPFVRNIDGENEDADFLDIYIIEFSALEMGMISMLHNNMKKMFRIMMVYLHWYLGKKKVKPQEQEEEEKKTAAGTDSGAALRASAYIVTILSEDEPQEKTKVRRKAKAAEEVKEAETVGVAEEVETTEEVKEPETVEAAEEAEVVEEAETAEEADNVEEAEAAEEADTAEEADAAEEVDTAEEAEAAEEVEVAEEAETAEKAETAEEKQNEAETTKPAVIADMVETSKIAVITESSKSAEIAEIAEDTVIPMETEGGLQGKDVEETDSETSETAIRDSEMADSESGDAKDDEKNDGKFADLLSDINNDVAETRLNDEYGYSEDSTVVPCYLNLGGTEVSPCFAPDEWYDFLKRILADYEELKTRKHYYSYSESSNECSFCGRKTLIIDVMDDGRRICNNCREHQVSQREEIMKVYKETVQMLEDVYNIEIKDNIRVQMKSAKAISQETGVSSNARVLGFYRHKSRELWIEARGPRNAVKDTIIHELTHAWQYNNLDMQKLDIVEAREKGLRLVLLEGHASYMEVDAMRRFGEERYADMLEEQLLHRDDEYGQGYRILKAYFEDLASKGSHMTPYKAMEELINSTAKRRRKPKMKRKVQKV